MREPKAPYPIRDGEPIPVSAVAAESGITRQVVESRRESGWSLIAALMLPKGELNPHGSATRCRAGGKYKGLAEKRWVAPFPSHTPGVRVPPEFMAPDGRRWLHVAGERGITYQMFYVRVRLGWSPEDAATRPRFRRGPNARPDAP